MLDATTPGTGRLSPPWRLGAFVGVPPHSNSNSNGLSQLKSRRRRTSGLGLNSDQLHAVPLPRASAERPERASAQRCRRRARWPAARVGAGTSRNRGSLSSAAPQTVADPAVQTRCGAEDTPNGRSIGNRGGGFAAGGIGVELECNSGGAGGSSSNGHVRVVGGEASTNVSATAALREELPYMGTGDESDLDGDMGGEGMEGEGELEAGVDEYR